MANSISIQVHLGNRQYRIKVNAEQEATVRRALQTIQETGLRLKKEFPGRDEQDYLAMTLMDFVTTVQMPSEARSGDDTELLQRLKKLSDLLDQ